MALEANYTAMVPGWRCLRCAHLWVSRGPDTPAVCPRCKSALWDRPPRVKAPTSAQEVEQPAAS